MTANTLRSPLSSTWLVFAVTVTLTTCALGQAKPDQTFSKGQIEYFEKHIRPALHEHCFQCHSETGDKIKGGLLLDTRNQTRLGGDSGPAVVPGNLVESLLFNAITYEDSSLEMPPKYKLDDDVIEHFRAWIEMGAPDPRESKGDPNAKYTSTIDIDEGRQFWAYQPPTATPAPRLEGDDWSRSEIDRFIYAGWQDKQLEPVADAEPRSLLRRLYFDLIGMPPRISTVEAFVEEYEADPQAAIAKAVDALLSSDHYGERWGRHWLDVARYSESNGGQVNVLYPQAWRYRDYVIDSFNEDKPYNTFVIEQLAGDKLSSDDKRERNSQVIATGFLALGQKNLNANSARQFRFDLVDEQIDTVGKTFLGTTIACARCHDHKFDPIPQSDYYAMAGIFLSSDTWFGTAQAVQNRHASELIELPHADEAYAFTPMSLGETIQVQYALHEAREELAEVQAALRDQRLNRRELSQTESDRIQRQRLRLSALIPQLEKRLSLYDEEGVPYTLAMGVLDSDEPFDAQLLVRGEEDQPTQRVPRGFVQVLNPNGEQPPLPADESGRLEMAQWIAAPENPLTARVMVNRVWHHLFGQGIVTSVDNFGSTGQSPSHPELLDYLAVRFVEENWSVKSLIREIVLSRSYQLSSDFVSANFSADPENHLIWRHNKRRLDAESVRDAVLTISGTLDTSPPVGSIVSRAGDGNAQLRIVESSIENGFNHRSVYLPIVRNMVPDALELFDFADPALVMGARETTTVPSQALYLMNSAFAIQQSEQMARHLIDNPRVPKKKLGQTAFYLAYSRPPTAEEAQQASTFYQQFVADAIAEGLSREEATFRGLANFCQALFASAEFRYLN